MSVLSVIKPHYRVTYVSGENKGQVAVNQQTGQSLDDATQDSDSAIWIGGAYYLSASHVFSYEKNSIVAGGLVLATANNNLTIDNAALTSFANIRPWDPSVTLNAGGDSSNDLALAKTNTAKTGASTPLLVFADQDSADGELAGKALTLNGVNTNGVQGRYVSANANGTFNADVQNLPGDSGAAATVKIGTTDYLAGILSTGNNQGAATFDYLRLIDYYTITNSQDSDGIDFSMNSPDLLLGSDDGEDIRGSSRKSNILTSGDKDVILAGSSGDLVNTEGAADAVIFMSSQNGVPDPGTTYVVSPGTTTLVGGNSDDEIVLLADRLWSKNGGVPSSTSLSNSSQTIQLKGGLGNPPGSQASDGFVEPALGDYWYETENAGSNDLVAGNRGNYAYSVEYKPVQGASGGIDLDVTVFAEDLSGDQADLWTSSILIKNFHQGDFGIQLKDYSQYIDFLSGNISAEALYATQIELQQQFDTTPQNAAGINDDASVGWVNTANTTPAPTDDQIKQDLSSVISATQGTAGPQIKSTPEPSMTYRSSEFSSEISAIAEDKVFSGPITLTDEEPPVVSLSAEEAGDYQDVLERVTNSSFDVDVHDSAANVAQYIGELEAAVKLTHVVVDDPQNAIVLSKAQADADVAVLSKISGPVTLQTADDYATLRGGSGDTELVATGRNEAFLYEASDGNLVIDSEQSGITSSDKLIFSDLNLSALIFSRSGNDLVINAKATGNTVVIKNQYQATGYGGVDLIELLDGSSLSRADLDGFSSTYAAGSGDQTITAADGDATMSAGLGNDTLIAGDENNNGAQVSFLYGSMDGNLEIQAHVYSFDSISNTLALTDLNASDVTISRSGSDLEILVNTTGKTVTVDNEFASLSQDGVQDIVFADGSTLDRTDIQGDAWYRAGPGDQTVVVQDGDATTAAGPGNDVIIAGPDDNNNGTTDTFVYSRQDGNLEIEAHVYSWNSVSNVLELTDLSRSDVTLARSGSDLLVSVDATGKVVTVDNEFNSLAEDGVQSVLFSDGSSLDRSQIEDVPVVVQVAAGNTTINATAAAGANAKDVIFDARNDTVYNTAGTAEYDYSSGDGYAQIFDAAAQTGVLKLTDLNPDDVTLSVAASPYVNHAATDLQILIKATGRVIDVYSQFSTEDSGINSIGAQGLSSIEFADGTTLDAAQIQAAAATDPETSSLVIGQSGSGNPNYDIGGESVHVVTTTGDTNSNTLSGVSDLVVDVYPGVGGDQTSLSPDSSDDLQTATVRLHGMSASDVVASQNLFHGGDVLLTDVMTGDTFDLGQELDANSNAFASVNFDDGTQWSRAAIQSNLREVVSGGGTLDVTFGTGSLVDAPRDPTNSGGGVVAEPLGSNGGEPSPPIVYVGIGGGTANISGAGGGTIRYMSFSGNLTVSDATSPSNPSDILDFADLSSGDVSLRQSGLDAVLTVASTGSTITLHNQFAGHGSGVSTIQFADGVTMDVTSPATTLVTTETSTSNESAITYDLGSGDHGSVQLYHDDPATIVWNAQDGNETFRIESNNYSNDATVEITGLTQSQVSFERAGDDLVVVNTLTGKTLTLTDGANASADYMGANTFVFDDGSSVSHASLEALPSIIAEDTSDTSGIVYDLGVQDSGNVNLSHDDPSTIIWAAGDGDQQFTIEGNDYQNSGTLKLVGLSLSDINIDSSGSDLVITQIATGKTMRIVNENNGDWRGVNQIVFDDGTVLDHAQITTQHAPVIVGSGDQTIQVPDGFYTVVDGTGNNDIVLGDSLAGSTSSTVQYASEDGNLTIDAHSSGAISDVLAFTDLNAADLSFSRSGTDLAITVNATGRLILIPRQYNTNASLDGVSTITFADGTSMNQAQIYAVQTVASQDTSNESHVVYDLGAGNHVPISAFHDDPMTVVWDQADGNESFTIESNNYTNDATLKLTNLDISDVRFERATSGALLIRNLSTDAVMTIANEFNNAWQGVYQVVFDDGTVLNQSQIAALAKIVGMPGSGDDAYDTNNQSGVVYDLGAGNHGLTSLSHDDPATVIWDAGDGNERFVIESNNYTNDATLKLTNLALADLQFTRAGSGALLLTNVATGATMTIDNQFNNAWQGVQAIVLDDGTTLTQSEIQSLAYVRDAVEIDNADVIYDLGAGDHASVRSTTDNSMRIIWNVADGNEEFYTYHTGDAANAANAVLQLDGLASGDVEFSRSGTNLIVQNTLTGKTMRIDNEFGNNNEGLGSIAFSQDGSSLSRSQIASMAYIRDTEEIDNADVIYDLGAGDHAAVRSTADNSATIIWSGNDGNEEFYTYHTGDAANPANAILQIDDLASGDVQLSRSGSNLIVENAQSGKTMTIDNEFNNNNEGLAAIDFTDGTTMSRDQIAAAAWFRAGDGSSVSLTANGNGETFQAGAGTDTFTDSYDQGTFVYSHVDGGLTIQTHTTTAHNDTLSLTDLNASDLTFSQNGSDLLIGVNATSHAITLAGEFNTAGQDGVQNIAFANGTTWNHDQIVAAAQHATS